MPRKGLSDIASIRGEGADRRAGSWEPRARNQPHAGEGGLKLHMGMAWGMSATVEKAAYA